MKRPLLALGLGCLLLASCSSVPEGPLPPPAQPEPAPSPAAEWQPYVTRTASPRDSIRRRRLPPPAAPAASPAAEAEAPSPASGPKPVDGRQSPALDGSWEREHVGEGFREAFEDALRRAAEGQASETDPVTGSVYAVSRKGGSGGCRAFEVNVLSPGGTLPVLSRGSVYRC